VARPDEAVRELAKLGARTAVIGSERKARSGCADPRLRACPRRRQPQSIRPAAATPSAAGSSSRLAATGDLAAAMAHGTVAAGFVAGDHGASHALIDRDIARERLADAGRCGLSRFVRSATSTS
jgi:hypothetical protein